MPFCSNCGNQVFEGDRFCGKCGTGQPGAGAPLGGAAPAPPPPEYAFGYSAPPPPPPPPPPSGAAPVLGGVSSNLASMLCYLPGLGWVAAILFLAFEPYRQDRYIRFHAFQGLYLFGVALLIQVVFAPWGHHNVWGGPFPFGWFWNWTGVLRLMVLIAQIVGIIKTLKHETYRLPVLAELADKSLV